MDLTFTDSETAFRDELRAWFAANAPGEEPAEEDANYAWRRDFQRRLAADGLAAVHWPPEYGGRGATLTESAIFWEELGRSGAPRRRRLGRQRPEGVDERRPVLEVVHARRAHGPRRAEAQGPDLLPDGHGAGGRAGRAAAPDHRRAGVQRALHRRRADPGRQRARRRGQRLESRADNAHERARRPRLHAAGAPAAAARRADGGGRGPRAARRPGGRRQARRPAAAHGDAAADRLPRADRDPEVRHARARGLAAQVDVVGRQPAARPARGRPA